MQQSTCHNHCIAIVIQRKLFDASFFFWYKKNINLNPKVLHAFLLCPLLLKEFDIVAKRFEIAKVQKWLMQKTKIHNNFLLDYYY